MKKTLLFVCCFFFFATCLSGCTISHKYGPYKGRVVDKETGEPIEGAVVFIRFFTLFQLSPGGPTSKLADAVEILTDQNGEFEIPRQRINTFRVFHGWDKYAPVIIFKPGYGAYPGHPGTEPHFGMAGSIPEDEFVIIKLPKLKTREERVRNLGYISFTSDVPYEKWRNLFEYRNIENIEVGLAPYNTPLKKDN